MNQNYGDLFRMFSSIKVIFYFYKSRFCEKKNQKFRQQMKNVLILKSQKFSMRNVEIFMIKGI